MAHGAAGPAGRTSERTPHLSRLLELTREHLAMDVALMSQFVDGRQVVRLASGDAAGMRIVLGQASPFE